MFIGDVLKDRRLKHGYSMRQVGDHVLNKYGNPVSREMINSIEQGRSAPPPGVIPQLAEALNINEDWLYYLAGRIPPWLRALEIDEDEWQVILGGIYGKHL